MMSGKQEILFVAVAIITLVVVWLGTSVVAEAKGGSTINTTVSQFEYDGVDGKVQIIVIRQTETVIEPKPQNPYFENVRQAQEWVDANKLPMVLIADDTGLISLNGGKFDSRYDCDDYATDFESLAYQNGWLVTQVPVTNGRIWGVKVTDLKGNHVGNWVKIDGTYYYIESSPSLHNWELIKIMDAD